MSILDLKPFSNSFAELINALTHNGISYWLSK